MKIAILVLSDPRQGGEDALGRVFNALAAAYDFMQKKEQVTVLFLGAGTRWVKDLADSSHPIHGLFELVKNVVAGASHGCADVFGAKEDIEKSPFSLLIGNSVPGTAGLPSLHKLVTDGYTVLTF